MHPQDIHKQHLREELRRRHGGFGPDFGGPGFGRGPFGPDGPLPPVPPGFGRGPRSRRGHRGRRGHRSRRGDIRAAVLHLLAEQPRHGYEIIGEIAERSNGLWRPSPGSVYPTLQLLADEDLVTSVDDGGKKRFELTDEGREAAEALGETPPWEQITHDVDPVEIQLRESWRALAGAIHQIGTVATSAQKLQAVKALKDARKALYEILIEDDEDEVDGGFEAEEG